MTVAPDNKDSNFDLRSDSPSESLSDKRGDEVEMKRKEEGEDLEGERRRERKLVVGRDRIDRSIFLGRVCGEYSRGSGQGFGRTNPENLLKKVGSLFLLLSSPFTPSIDLYKNATNLYMGQTITRSYITTHLPNTYNESIEMPSIIEHSIQIIQFIHYEGHNQRVENNSTGESELESSQRTHGEETVFGVERDKS